MYDRATRFTNEIRTHLGIGAGGSCQSDGKALLVQFVIYVIDISSLFDNSSHKTLV